MRFYFGGQSDCDLHPKRSFHATRYSRRVHTGHLFSDTSGTIQASMDLDRRLYSDSQSGIWLLWMQNSLLALGSSARALQAFPYLQDS